MPDPVTEIKSPMSDSLAKYLNETLSQIQTSPKKFNAGFGISQEGAEVTVGYKFKPLTIAGYATKDFRGGFGWGLKGIFSF